MNALSNIFAEVAARAPIDFPPITAKEAARLVRRLCRKFGATRHGSPSMTEPYRWSGEPPGLWVSKRSTGSENSIGFGRLLWDIAWRIAQARCPKRQASNEEFEALRRQMLRYVIAQGWLVPGALATKPRAKKPPPTAEQRRDQKTAHLRAQLKRWQTRHKFAGNRIKKLSRAIAAAERRAALREHEAGCDECERANGPHYTGPCEHGGAA